MRSQRSEASPKGLWCSEYLTDSPSTASKTWTYSTASVEYSAPQHRTQSRHSTRKQPFAVLPISPLVEQQYEYQSENVFPQKNRHEDRRLNQAQRQFVPVDLDKCVHWDNRTLISLLNSERHGQKHFGDPRMLVHRQDNNRQYLSYRSEAARWLFEVCDEESCDYGIFPLAVTYLNRVLFLERIPTESLQAVACACLFIASKMKAPTPITAKQLSHYTDGFVSAEIILKWEIMITNLLKWNMSLCTVFEFFDQLMVRVPDLEFVRESFCNVVYSIQIDDELCFLLPSVQCALAVCYLTLNSAKWLEYRKLVKICLDVDFLLLKHYVTKLDPKLTDHDLAFFQLNTEKHCQRRSVYQTNPFVALV